MTSPPRLPTLLTIALTLATLPTLAPAQCQPFGSPCPGGQLVSCANPPRIGTTWRICENNETDTIGNMMLFGSCIRGLQLPSPPACTTCRNCSVHVAQVVAVPWSSGCFSLNIPNDRNLVGTSLCVQNAAVRRQPCVCLSNTILVTVMP
jgi:hypothetical protein